MFSFTTKSMPNFGGNRISFTAVLSIDKVMINYGINYSILYTYIIKQSKAKIETCSSNFLILVDCKATKLVTDITGIYPAMYIIRSPITIC